MLFEDPTRSRYNNDDGNNDDGHKHYLCVELVRILSLLQYSYTS